MAPSRRVPAPGPSVELRGPAARLDIRTFPSTDKDFARDVRQAVALSGIAAPEALQEMLRPSFPRVIVHERELSGEVPPTWYVFRDGRVV